MRQLYAGYLGSEFMQTRGWQIECSVPPGCSTSIMRRPGTEVSASPSISAYRPACFLTAVFNASIGIPIELALTDF